LVMNDIFSDHLAGSFLPMNEAARGAVQCPRAT